MDVQCDMQVPVVKPFHKTFRIGEEFPVPCISCPAASVFWIDVYQMPVHIDNSNRERKVLVFKAIHQFLVRFFGVFIVTAPPVPECVARNHRTLSAQAGKVPERLQIVMPVSPEIDVDASFAPGLNPSVFPDSQRPAVVHYREAVPAYDTVLQRNSAVRLIQSTGSPAQIFEIFAVMPDTVISAVVADGLYGETVGRERIPVIDQMRLWRDDLQGIVLIYHAEGASWEIAVPHGLGSPVFKNPVRVIFKTEKPFCKDRYPPAVSFNDIFRCSLRMSFCD